MERQSVLNVSVFRPLVDKTNTHQEATLDNTEQDIDYLRLQKPIKSFDIFSELLKKKIK